MGYVNKTYLSTQFKNFADKIAKVFSKIGHTHLKSDITDFPTSMPANGGNAATVGGHTVGVNVPSNAKFTDTWRPVIDNLTSTATDSSLSANQGKVLNDKISELSNYYQKKSYVHTVDKDGSSTLVIPFPYADTAIITIYLNGVHLIEGTDYHIMSTGNIIFQHALKKDTKIEFDVFQSVAITDEDWTKFQPPIDSALSSTSINPVQNKVINEEINTLKSKIVFRAPSKTDLMTAKAMILTVANSTSYFSTVFMTQTYGNYQFVYDYNGEKRACAIVWDRTNGTLTFTSSNADTSQYMSIYNGIIFFE